MAIGSATFTIFDGCFKIDLVDVLVLIILGKVNSFGFWCVWFFNGRRGNSSVLISLRKIDDLADAVFQKQAVSFDEFFVHLINPNERREDT